MHHAAPLITTVAAGFGLALIFGFLAQRLHLPALVGYLFAGIVISPNTPGFVADVGIAGQLAEIGVMLLMFGVGLHLSLADLLAVRRIALPGAIVQMAVATLMGAAVALAWGWSAGAALVFGVSLSCASTVVLLKALERNDLLETGNGRIAVGWLVVEDLAMVIVLVLLPPLAQVLGGQSQTQDWSDLAATLGRTVLAVVAFIALMLVGGRRVLPWMLWQVTKVGSHELFTLCVVTVAVSVAYGAAELFGVSFALGAFFAGMVLRESEFSHRAATETLPLRDAFSVLFFVSVGMLFDPGILIEQPLQVLAVVAIIVCGKSLAAAALVIALRYTLQSALVVSASLAQIGEFSFILVMLGASLELLPRAAQSLVVAGAVISIALNPLAFALIAPLRRLLLRRSALLRRLEHRPDPLAALPAATDARFLSGHVVLVGFGRVGRRIAAELDKSGVPYVIAESNRDSVDELRARGLAAVVGNAADPRVLVQAHIAHAGMLVVASAEPDLFQARQMVDIARALNPTIEVAVRTHSDEEARLIAEIPGACVFSGEEELALAMNRHVLARFGKAPARAQ